MRAVLDQTHCDPAEQLDVNELCVTIVTLAQTLAEKQYYPYQVSFAYRVIQSLLLRDSEVITALMARQIGKTQTMGPLIAACIIILPFLAKKFPKSWMLNITDENGVYRGFAHGFSCGIYAPKKYQAELMFDRVKTAMETETAKKVMAELKVTDEVYNGNLISLSNGSRCLCETASLKSKIEGETWQLLVLEEAQDIPDIKIRKSLYPMASSTAGTTVMVGTAIPQKCEFYSTIKQNQRMQLQNDKVKNYFCFPYQIGTKYNSLYRKYIEQQKTRLGETSDEFRASYNCLAEDTPVFLSGGSTKSIKDINIGDEIVSHTGLVREVTYKQYKGRKKAVRIRFYGAEDICCTPDHRFLTDSGWVEAKNLSKSHKLLIPIPKRVVTSTSVPTFAVGKCKRRRGMHQLPVELALTPELGEWLGWFVAEGCCNKANESQIELCLSVKEVKEAARLVDLTWKVFKLKSKVEVKGPCLIVRMQSKQLNQFLARLFKSKAKNKCLPNWFFETPEPFLRAFITSLWQGDGGYALGRRSAMFTTASVRLWRQLDMLLRQFGILASSYSFVRPPSYINGRRIYGGLMYQLWVYGLNSENVLDKSYSSKKQYYKDAGYLVRTIKSVSDDQLTPMWDLEVDTDHSFCLPSATVHNCEWLFERGMFITEPVLFNRKVAQLDGYWSVRHPRGLDSRVHNGFSVVAGIDWGSIHDSTFITTAAVDWANPLESYFIADADGEHEYVAYEKHIIDWQEHLGDDYEYQFHRIVEYLLNVKRLRKVTTDSNACGKPIYDRLAAVLAPHGIMVEPFNFSFRLKAEGYRLFYNDLCGKRLTFPAGKLYRDTRYLKFINQMLDLRKSYKNGVMSVAHPEEKGAHDDAPDSAMLASWAAAKPSYKGDIEAHSHNPFIR